ncbi:DUF2284 domain-containing protein [Eubacteriaceae bacterium ES3]|nr:DUF2284 domain-containing protein [Eubacteriaceae bacterium ES3]
MELEKILELAMEKGFSKAIEMDVNSIDLKDEVRQMCQDNKCQIYGKNWACPPGCGSIPECREKVKAYSKGILLQTTGELEDSFDFEGMEEIKEEHEKSFTELVEVLAEQKLTMLPLGDGCCTICSECTYPDKPCRFPEKAISSVEAYGILVSELCQKNEVDYYYGPNTLTYVGCVLFE